MSRFVAPARRLLVLLLILQAIAGTGGRAAFAQSGDVDPSAFESELSGIEIEIDGDDFEIHDAYLQTYSHGQGEIVEIASNTAYVQIALFDDTDTNDETLEIYNTAFAEDVDDFEVLDEEQDGDTVFTFALATYNGVEFYYYLSVTQDVEDNVDLLQRIFATDASFFDDFADAQEAISIDRDGFLEAVDVADLEELADDGSSRRDEPEEEPTEVVEEEPTEEPAEAVPTLDPSEGTVHDLVVINAELVATDAVSVGEVSAEPPSFAHIAMGDGIGEAAVVLNMVPFSPEATLDHMLSVFAPDGGVMENVGTDADRTSAWSLDRIEDQGESYLLYVHVQSDRFQRFHFTEVLFAPVDDLSGTMSTFRDNVQVGGIPLFAEADLPMLEDLLGGGGDDRTRNAPEDEEEQDDKRDTEGTDENRGGLDLESQGLVSETEYESPQYGVTVEWDDSAWAVDLEWEQTAQSDEAQGIDSLVLLSAEREATMLVQFISAEGEEPEAYIETWTSDDYLVEMVHEDAEVLLDDSGRSSGAVLYRSYTQDGDETMIVQEVLVIDDEVVAIVTVLAADDAIADAYADAEDFVEIDGDEAVGTFTPREVERAIAD